MTTSTTTDGRHDARPKDDAVVTAARLVFAIHGPDAPVSAVAAEAGVGIGSLYRRFPSKQALLQYLCVESMRQFETLAEAALGEPDPWTAFTAFVRECVELRAGAFGATLAGVVETTAQMRQLAKRGQELLDELLTRARRSGAVRDDVTAVDVRLLIELFSRRSREGAGGHQRLLDLALDGWSATGVRTPLTTPPLDWRSYLARWRTPPSGPREPDGR